MSKYKLSAILNVSGHSSRKESDLVTKTMDAKGIKKCSGNDMREWGPDTIFDVTCKHCSNPVEFFKDNKKLTFTNYKYGK